jgi:hypothetical protein
VSFATTSTNLVDGDDNEKSDVFVRDTKEGITERVSVTASGDDGDGDSPAGQGERAALSGDGSIVIFTSSAVNITGSSNGNTKVVVRNRITGQNEILASDVTFGVGNRPAVSSDNKGCYTAFFSSDSLDPRFDSSGVFFHQRCDNQDTDTDTSTDSDTDTPTDIDTQDDTETPVDTDTEAQIDTDSATDSSADCIDIACTAELEACAADLDCLLLYSCIADCADEQCQNDCVDAFPNGVDLLNSLITCANDNCP